MAVVRVVIELTVTADSNADWYARGQAGIVADIAQRYMRCLAMPSDTSYTVRVEDEVKPEAVA